MKEKIEERKYWSTQRNGVIEIKILHDGIKSRLALLGGKFSELENLEFNQKHREKKKI